MKGKVFPSLHQVLQADITHPINTVKALMFSRYLNISRSIPLAYFCTAKKIELDGPVVKVTHTGPISDPRLLLFDAGLRKDWQAFKQWAREIRRRGLDKNEIVKTTAIMTRMVTFPDNIFQTGYVCAIPYLLFKDNARKPACASAICYHEKVHKGCATDMAYTACYHGKEFRYIVNMGVRTPVSHIELGACQADEVYYDYIRSHRQGNAVEIIVSCYVTQYKVFMVSVLGELFAYLCELPPEIMLSQLDRSVSLKPGRAKFRIRVSDDPAQRYITPGILSPKEERCSWVELASDYCLGTAYLDTYLMAKAMDSIDRTE